MKFSNRRLRATMTVAASTALAGALMAGPASADVFFPSVYIKSKQNGQCVAKDSGNNRLHLEPCANNSRMKWEVHSYNSDSPNGVHNVRVYNLANRQCMTVDSGRASLETCLPGQVSNQIWALTGNSNTAANWQFYTYDIHACLDSGQSSSLLYRQNNGCNTGNNYQYWGLPTA
ncbi:ricin-type beta-trefoil lectin domain protein [Actinomadura roseirufa]|uniref:ricin-type beta-trefoil lectin domain protein n=1 Tax=Actinomadura roseirufa TaxID=2094049 RepID=UPI0010419628|nr:ricin-type beta-trefoil lectin domain protein [Actinomadura roseirufa]